LTGKIEFDPNDPIWAELSDIFDETVHCPSCGGQATSKYIHEKFDDIELEMARMQWTCHDCNRHGQGLTYWRRYGDKAPNRWRVRATQANFQEILLELRRYPFWVKLLESSKPILFASRIMDGRAYVSVNEILEFLAGVISDHVYLDEDDELWPEWAK